MTSLRDESEAADIVSKAVVRKLGPNRAELTLSNGITFEFRPVSPILTNSVRAELEARLPKPPVVFLEEKGRSEENPNDPEYLQELRRMEFVNDIALSDALTYAGAQIKHVPEGIYPPEDDRWMEDPRIVVAVRNGLELDPTDAVKRKVVWMRLYAIETYVDARLWDEVQSELLGIREDEVSEALQGFRPVPPRGEDNGSPAPEASGNGDSSNRAGRRRSARVRGKGG